MTEDELEKDRNAEGGEKDRDAEDGPEKDRDAENEVVMKINADNEQAKNREGEKNLSPKKGLLKFFAVVIISVLLGAGSSLALVPVVYPNLLTGQSYVPQTSDSSNVVQNKNSGSGNGTNYPVVEISKAVGPAVVGIANFQQQGTFFGGSSELAEVSSGSGFIIDAAKGYIVTNNHVVEGASKIVVSLADGRNITGRVVGGDSRTDLAVVQIAADKLTAVKLGDSSAVQVGQPVVAIGNPGGQEFARSVTTGVISATNRIILLQGEANFNLIQTDAAINPGNSGGPLVDYSGEVIGINSVKNQQQGYEGMGFAIPITDALPTINQLIQKGYAVHPGLMVSIDNRYTEEWASQKGWPAGAYVSGASTDGPAYKAGIREGDILTKINAVEVKNSLELTRQLFKYQVGDRVTVTYFRQGKIQNVQITLAELKS